MFDVAVARGVLSSQSDNHFVQKLTGFVGYPLICWRHVSFKRCGAHTSWDARVLSCKTPNNGDFHLDTIAMPRVEHGKIS